MCEWMCGCCAEETRHELELVPLVGHGGWPRVARIDGHADNEARERDGEERSFTVGVLLESVGVGDERKRRGKVLPVKQGRKRTTGR